MYTYENKIRTRLYLTFLVWTSVLHPVAYAPSSHKRLHPEHSLLHPQPNDLNLWNLDGTARFRDGVLNLVPSKTYKTGLAWSGIPVDYCNWEVNIKFSIQSDSYYPGDGWAMFYTEEPITKRVDNPSMTTMGGPDDYKGLAIIYDSYDNNYKADGYFPRVYPVLLNGDYKQRHYDNGFNQRPYSCYYDCTNDQCHLRFEYWNRTIWMASMRWNGEVVCYHYSYNVALPPGGYFSFTALNDYYYETVDIIEFKVEEILDGTECFERDGQKPKWDHYTY
ncbi:unnamed protein product [Calicophoron daubneyi]|uniref:L-type lectin-like domain-containing protein n=1 Tax=Calicophoron daubneyi TaxID=300641 RepID=A0AAV2TQ59_CALDB